MEWPKGILIPKNNSAPELPDRLSPEPIKRLLSHPSFPFFGTDTDYEVVGFQVVCTDVDSEKYGSKQDVTDR
jgi:hypothetical protein